MSNTWVLDSSVSLNGLGSTWTLLIACFCWIGCVWGFTCCCTGWDCCLTTCCCTGCWIGCSSLNKLLALSLNIWFCVVVAAAFLIAFKFNWVVLDNCVCSNALFKSYL